MRDYLSIVAASCIVALTTGSESVAEPTIAVFTKNSTNPAYEAFRIGADQVARGAGIVIER